MTGSATFRAPNDYGSVQVIADSEGEAERLAHLFRKIARKYSTTVGEIYEMVALAVKEEEVGEGRPLGELRRRMARDGTGRLAVEARPADWRAGRDHRQDRREFPMGSFLTWTANGDAEPRRTSLSGRIGWQCC